MALSQIQCLDDNNVNPRTHESKVEFFYCEDQRLALEALLRDGREAFVKYLEARGLRGFLSDLEQEVLAAGRQPYDPGCELLPEDKGDGENTPLSLHYWPDLSDTSIPQMDLGWPDSDGYRGVTRTTVYTQPPMEGQTHVKEVVRKMISQAQKVIAVVMDVFTDVDIFRDLMDVSYKKKVSVYILLERSNLTHFLSMCQRANMHPGHLKHLRVRCTQGADFYTRSCTKVTGRLGHRFMFIDGDKAVSGSYGFTWMSSRLDRNLITVTTGQAVDGFDKLFRFLYATSSFVDLKQVATESEPEPERLPQPTAVAPPSADVARKLYNPKYALVAATNPSPTTSVGCDSPKEPQTPENPKKKRRLRDCEEEPPPLHPGLVDLEKAYLIPYLPTWPEPDPPSDVIGFINIIDTKKPTQVHLQRSEMFETSQAIRFSSPFSKTEETLPEVTKPRQLTAKHEPIDNTSAQINIKPKEMIVDKTQNKLAEPSDSPRNTKTEEKQILSPHVSKYQLNKDTIRAPNTDNKLYSYTTPNQDAGSQRPSLSAHTDLHLSNKAPVSNKGTASYTTNTVSTNRPKSDPLLDLSKGTKTFSQPNKESIASYKTHTLDSNSTQTPQLPRLSDSKTKEDTKTQAVHNTPEQISSPSAAINSTFQFQKNHIAITTVNSGTTASASISTTSPSSHHPPTSPLTTQTAPPSTSFSLTSPPPVPKPRTVQLLIKDDSSSNNSQVCLVRKPTAEQAVALNEPPGHSAVLSSPPPEPQTVPQLQDKNASTTDPIKYTDDTRTPQENPQQTKGKEPDGQLDDKVRTTFLTRKKLEKKSFVSDFPKMEIIPKDNISQTLISMDKNIAQKTETENKSAAQTNTNVSEKHLTGNQFPQLSNEKVENGTQPKTYLAKAREPQSISYYRLTPPDIGGFEAVDSLKETNPPAASTSHKLHISKDIVDSGTHAFAADTLQHGKQAVLAPAQCKDSVLNRVSQSTHNNMHKINPQGPTNKHTPEKNLSLQLPDSCVPELRTLSPERASRPVPSPVRTPTPDRFLPRTPTPDLQTPMADPRSYTPDFRTPTPDVSDGYVSPREDSNLSTTSEEYYECSDSPFHESVMENFVHHKHGTTEDHVILTHKNSPNTSAPDTAPDAASSRSADSNISWSENDRGSSSSVIEIRAKIREAESTDTQENGKGEGEKGRKVSSSGSCAEQESLETERRDSEAADRIVNHLEQGETSTETAIKGTEIQVQRRKRVLNPSDRLIDRGGTAGDTIHEQTNLKRLPSGDLKPGRVTAEGKGPDKVSSERERLSNPVVLRSNMVERREKSQSSRETEEPKIVLAPPKNPRVQQQDVVPSSSSRPPRPPRPLSGSQYMGARPWGSRPLNQTESRALEILEGSANKPPSRPPLPTVVSSAGAGRKQVSPSQQLITSRQSLAGQSRTKAAPTLGQTIPQRPSFLHTHSNMQAQPHPTSQSQQVSIQESTGQEEGKMPFGFTFSKLYSLRGLKDKIGKTPAQGRKTSSSSPVEARKSTS